MAAIRGRLHRPSAVLELMSQLWQECLSEEAKMGLRRGCKHQHFLSLKDLEPPEAPPQHKAST